MNHITQPWPLWPGGGGRYPLVISQFAMENHHENRSNHGPSDRNGYQPVIFQLATEHQRILGSFLHPPGVAKDILPEQLRSRPSP